MPSARLFFWCVRHSAHILSCYVVRREGLTPYKALNGLEMDEKLAVFGEVVQFKINSDEKRGKSLARWKRGVFAGTSRTSKTSILLTEAGYVTARVIGRLAHESQWDGEFLQRVAGPPWSRSVGPAGGARSLLLRSMPEPTAVPTTPPSVHFGPGAPGAREASSSSSPSSRDDGDGKRPTQIQQKTKTTAAPNSAQSLFAPTPVGAPAAAAPMGPTQNQQALGAASAATPATQEATATSSRASSSTVPISGYAPPTPPALPASIATPRRDLPPGVVPASITPQRRAAEQGIEQLEYDIHHASRGGALPRRGPPPGPAAAIIGGLVEAEESLARSEFERIAGVEEAAAWLNPTPNQHDLRIAETENLAGLRCFRAVPRTSVPRSTSTCG